MTEAPNSEIRRLQTLLETVRLLNSTLELKELTRIILEVVRAEIAVERISVFVVDRLQNRLRPLVTQEMEGDVISLPVGVGIAGTVATTGEVLDIPDAYADSRFDPQFDRRYGYYTNDLFALPVCNRGGEIVGVLELLNRLRAITPSDREFLLGISVYIGLALENSLLHSELLARKQRENSRKPEPSQASGQEVDKDIHDPLAFVMGYFELAPDEHDLPKVAWILLEDVRSSITQTAAAAIKFREYLEHQRQEIAPINLGDALRQLSELQAEAWDRHNITATLIAESVPPVYACEYELRIVLSFLMRSAETAVRRSESNRRIWIHVWCAGKSVHVSIHHVGLSAESGTSRGFAVAMLILRQYGGQIRLESALDQGTTFFIDLPVLQQPVRD